MSHNFYPETITFANNTLSEYIISVVKQVYVKHFAKELFLYAVTSLHTHFSCANNANPMTPYKPAQSRKIMIKHISKPTHNLFTYSE